MVSKGTSKVFGQLTKNYSQVQGHLRKKGFNFSSKTVGKIIKVATVMENFIDVATEKVNDFAAEVFSNSL